MFTPARLLASAAALWALASAGTTRQPPCGSECLDHPASAPNNNIRSHRTIMIPSTLLEDSSDDDLVPNDPVLAGIAINHDSADDMIANKPQTEESVTGKKRGYAWDDDTIDDVAMDQMTHSDTSDQNKYLSPPRTVHPHGDFKTPERAPVRRNLAPKMQGF